jgi:hypothetical protein
MGKTPAASAAPLTFRYRRVSLVQKHLARIYVTSDDQAAPLSGAPTMSIMSDLSGYPGEAGHQS